MKSGYLFIKENVVLRSDKKRTVIYFKETHHQDKMIGTYNNKITFTALSPDLATAFCLMDGTKDYQTIAQFVKEYFKLKESEFYKFDELLNGYLGIYYSTANHPLPIRNHQYELGNVLPDLKCIDEYDMSANYLFYPYSFLLIPSLICNVDCIYCYANKKYTYNSLTIDQWEEIIYETAVKFKAKDISVSGGDIFLYPYWKEFVTLLAYYKYYPELPTKSPLSISDQQFLYDLGFKSYQISLDTLSLEILGETLQITEPEEYKKELLRSIETANNVGLKLSINSVQTRFSYHDIYETMQQLAIFNHIYRIAIDAIEFSLYKDGVESLMLREEDIPEYLHQIGLVKTLFQNQDVLLNFNEYPIWVGKNYKLDENEYMERKQCNGGRTGVVILPDGKVTVCEELYWNKKYIIGDLQKQSLLDVFESPDRWKLITPIQSSIAPDSPCRQCDADLFKKCTQEKGRCWRESLKQFNKEDFPDYRCPFWEKTTSEHVDMSCQHVQLIKSKRNKVSKTTI